MDQYGCTTTGTAASLFGHPVSIRERRIVYSGSVLDAALIPCKVASLTPDRSGCRIQTPGNTRTDHGLACEMSWARERVRDCQLCVVTIPCDTPHQTHSAGGTASYFAGSVVQRPEVS